MRAKRNRDCVGDALSILGRTSALWGREIGSDMHNYWAFQRTQSDFYGLRALREQVLRRSSLLKKN